MSIIVTSDVQLFINGSLFAEVSGFTFDSSTPVKSIVAVDSLVPYELAPLATAVSGSIQCFRRSLSGGLEGIGITTTLDQVAKQKYVTIALKQLSTNQFVFESRFSTITHQSWSIPTKNLMTGNFNFTGISWNNEISANQG